MIIDYIPFTRIGNFYLGDNISLYSSTYKFLFEACDDKTGWDVYSLDEYGIVIYTDSLGVVESISCSKSLVFKGKEVIGVNILDFLNTFGFINISDPDSIDMSENEVQNVYEIDEIGLQIWCLDDLIVTVIAS